MTDNVTLEDIEKIATPYIPQPCEYILEESQFSLYPKQYIYFLASTGCYNPTTCNIYRPKTNLLRAFYDYAIIHETNNSFLSSWMREVYKLNLTDLNTLISEDYVKILMNLVGFTT